MYYGCSIVVVGLLACLAYVSAFPPTFLAYTGEAGGATLLDCTEITHTNYRCHPVRRGGSSSSSSDLPLTSPNSLPQEVVQEEDQGNVVLEITEEEEEVSQASPQEEVEVEARVDPSFVVSIPGQEAARNPRCAGYEIYVPELDECVDVIEHLKAPVMTDPRVARWYSWRNAIIEARGRERGF